MTDPCVFCSVEAWRVVWESALCFAVRDAFAVSPGHTLVVPRRHVATWFEASLEEQHALFEGVAAVRVALDAEYGPDGYNVGFNAGAAAGQTVMHLHVHVIPRYQGDVADPRGGVRHVIPGKGNYLVAPAVGGLRQGSLHQASASQPGPHQGVLVRGEDDAFLPHLRAQIDAACEVDIAVAFVLQSGIDALEGNLRDLLARGGRLRLVTGDYLDVTDPDALARLLDLAASLPREQGPLGLAGDASDLTASEPVPLLPQEVTACSFEPFLPEVHEAGISSPEASKSESPSEPEFGFPEECDPVDASPIPHAFPSACDSAAASLQLRVFDGQALSFHPKAYIFRTADGQGVACVGSSNLSATALRTGVEWNLRLVSSRDAQGFAEIEGAFERLFGHPHTQALDLAWLEAYRARRRLQQRVESELAAVQRSVPGEPERPAVVPHGVQAEALQALAASRAQGHRAALVVLATGLGKTWLAAFDSHAFAQSPEGQARAQARALAQRTPWAASETAATPVGATTDRGLRVLFVAHREEILAQAVQTFRRIRPEARLGVFAGKERSGGADVVFASVQTLARRGNLEGFARDAFDYVVIDEFHHASAPTYRRLIEWFEPAFLLGLTATPDRSDEADLLALCGDHLAYRCDLAEGIRRGLLSPFAYYGVPDEVEYDHIPWRNRRFDPAALESAVATETRARNALEQYRTHGGQRALAFCVGVRHANYMADFFNRHGLRAVAVHGGEGSAPRATSLERLAAGELDVVCAVDMLNEGVDVPDLDTVLMLRPTESRIMWLQQIGRGLRRREGKLLKIIDYIGNHRSFLLKPQVLLGSLCDLQRPWSRAELRLSLEQLGKGELELPPGCSVTYDLEVLDLLHALLPAERVGEALLAYYDDFRAVQGVRPTALEALRDGYNPRVARDEHESWVGLVVARGDLAQEVVAPYHAWFVELERMAMTRSYKVLLVQAMLSLGKFPGAVTLDELAEAFVRVARRSPQVTSDIDCDLGDPKAVRAHLRKNPIQAWTGGFAAKASPWFAFEGGELRFLQRVEEAHREVFVALTEELLEWRLADYLRRAGGGEEVAHLKVSHANGNPMLFLDRTKVKWLPTGWTPVRVGAEIYEFNFVKIAVNVARKPGQEGNLMHALLRDLFGERAGQPGSAVFARLRRTAEGLRLEAEG